LVDWDDDNGIQLKPVTETKDFVYVATPDYVATPGYLERYTDISPLNQWLRVNPDKKVVSFSGVLAYREGVSGYILYFVSGDNSQQRFKRINLKDRRSRRSGPEPDVYGISALQTWKDEHPNARIVAVSTVPSYSGGVREFTIYYEE